MTWIYILYCLAVQEIVKKMCIMRINAKSTMVAFAL